MYDCEICGRASESLFVIEVEGTQLAACQGCTKGKTIIDVVGLEAKERKPIVAEEKNEALVEIIDNYGEEIRKARERLGMPLTVLAERINEKHSTLLRVEKNRMLPSEKLTAKLEKELGIRLAAKSDVGAKNNRPGKNEPVTLGDAAVKKNGRR